MAAAEHLYERDRVVEKWLRLNISMSAIGSFLYVREVAAAEHLYERDRVVPLRRRLRRLPPGHLHVRTDLVVNKNTSLFLLIFGENMAQVR